MSDRPLLRLELLETEPGSFTVICDGQFADRLCRDEAMGVLAGALFCNTQRPPFLKTYAQWDAWNRRYALPTDNHRAPVALLTMRTTQ